MGIMTTPPPRPVREPRNPATSDPAQITIGLRWKSGASQQVQVTRRRSAIQLRCTDPAAIGLARRIGPGLDNNALAAALNDAGHRTGTGGPAIVPAGSGGTKWRLRIAAGPDMIDRNPEASITPFPPHCGQFAGGLSPS